MIYVMMNSRKNLRGIIEEERRRNLEDAIRHAVWNAEVVRRLARSSLRYVTNSLIRLSKLIRDYGNHAQRFGRR